MGETSGRPDKDRENTSPVQQGKDPARGFTAGPPLGEPLPLGGSDPLSGGARGLIQTARIGKLSSQAASTKGVGV